MNSPFITLKEYSRQQTKVFTKYQLTWLFGSLSMANIVFAMLTRVSSPSFDTMRFSLTLLFIVWATIVVSEP